MVFMMKKMNNETAIITGSTSGIGKKLSELFLREGCKVTICSRSEKKVQETVKEFKKDYGEDKVIGVTCDVTDILSLQNVVNKTVDTFGSVRILVANAGRNLIYGPFINLASNPEQLVKDLKTTVETNMIGAINSIATVLPQMYKQKYGRIITLSGGGADRPLENMTFYSSSKGGVVTFSKCLAEELKNSHEDIAINIFQPGMIATNLGTDIRVAEGWKESDTFQYDNDLIFKLMGTEIEKSCRKVISYVLPSNKNNGKTFRGFSLIKMIRGGRKYQKEKSKKKN